MWPKVTEGKLSFLPIPIGTSPLLLLADVGWVPTSARCGSSSESLDSDRIQKYAMLRPQAATAIQMVIEARPAFLAAAGMAAPAGRLSTARRVIAAESRELLFSTFYRVPGQYGAKGTGLGLALVRQIARRHAGDVAYNPERGSCFTVTLPAIA